MRRFPAIRRALPGVVLVATAAVPAAAQTPFQWEVGADYLDREFTASSNFGEVFEVDTTGFGVSAQWFFEPVATDSGPLERAAFLDRASLLSISFAQSEAEAEFSETDSDVFALGARYQFQSNWFIAGSIGES
ncbi:MAG: putative porin, partial [Pseudomonadota bacterium]